MGKIVVTIAWLLMGVTISSCPNFGKKKAFHPKVVYRTEHLTITQLSGHAYQHTSYLLSEDFGKVACNGLFVQGGDEVVVFDTPATPESTLALIEWITHGLNSKIVALVPTHFHDDCLAGLREFETLGVPSHANIETIALAKGKGGNVPRLGFRDSLVLTVGQERVVAKFFGEGHTRDNVIGYFPSENIMFGGCLIKASGAGKGNLEDANPTQWPKTVEKIKREYPHVDLIVPGHGKFGNQDLLDYTIQLFRAP